ncbi:MAG: hypothetical protein QOF53_2672 [Nocardioidaceae bacterium]|nr:hypothetical protein [Nocardioidaceae bacterium]
MVLITISCLLAPLSVVSVWASRQVSDTDRYVATVAPLAHDPAVQRALANTVTTEVLKDIDLRGLTQQALDALAARGVPPAVAANLAALSGPLTNGVESFTRTQINKFVASPAFARLWVRANRTAHANLVTLLEGRQGGAVSTNGDEVTLNLAPIVAQVKQQLVAGGFTIANRIPVANRTFVLARSDSVTRAQGVYRLLNAIGLWLPVLALLLFGGGVLLARDRRKGLLLGSLGVLGSMLLLGVLLAVARPLYLNAVPASVLPSDAAGDVFDTVVQYLRYSLRTVAAVALVLALGAFFLGPSAGAVRARSDATRTLGALRGSAESAGLNTGRFGTWTFAHKRLLRIATVVLAAVVLSFWGQPTGVVVLGIALVALFVLAVIELVGRPPVARATVPVPEQRQRVLAEQGPEATARTEESPSGPAGTEEQLPSAR